MKNKKILTLIMLFLVICLTGCTSNKKNEETNTQTKQEEKEELKEVSYVRKDEILSKIKDGDKDIYRINPKTLFSKDTMTVNEISKRDIIYGTLNKEGGFVNGFFITITIEDFNKQIKKYYDINYDITIEDIKNVAIEPIDKKASDGKEYQYEILGVEEENNDCTFFGGNKYLNIEDNKISYTTQLAHGLTCIGTYYDYNLEKITEDDNNVYLYLNALKVVEIDGKYQTVNVVTNEVVESDVTYTPGIGFATRKDDEWEDWTPTWSKYDTYKVTLIKGEEFKFSKIETVR